jgi:hypothetical protein
MPDQVSRLQLLVNDDLMCAHQLKRDLVVAVLPLPPHRLGCLGKQDNKSPFVVGDCPACDDAHAAGLAPDGRLPCGSSNVA